MSTIEETLEALREGQIIILVDEESADSDGSFCVAGDKVTPEIINFLLSYGRCGILYLTLTEEKIKQLGILGAVQPSMSMVSAPVGLPIDAKIVIPSGVSAAGRAQTIKTALAAGAKPGDLAIPGNVFPAQTRNGGRLSQIRPHRSLGGFGPSLWVTARRSYLPDTKGRRIHSRHAGS